MRTISFSLLLLALKILRSSMKILSFQDSNQANKNTSHLLSQSTHMGNLAEDYHRIGTTIDYVFSVFECLNTIFNYKVLEDPLWHSNKTCKKSFETPL